MCFKIFDTLSIVRKNDLVFAILFYWVKGRVTVSCKFPEDLFSYSMAKSVFDIIHQFFKIKSNLQLKSQFVISGQVFATYITAHLKVSMYKCDTFNHTFTYCTSVWNITEGFIYNNLIRIFVSIIGFSRVYNRNTTSIQLTTPNNMYKHLRLHKTW